MTGAEWIALIQQKDNEEYERSRNISPVYNVRASQVGLPACQIFHSIVNWNHRKPFSKKTLEKFEDGNLHERAVIDWLRNIGFDTIGAQMAGSVRHYNRPVITAHLDTIVVHRESGSRILAEVKSMVGYAYDKIHSVPDLLSSKWYAGYYDQMQVYMEAFREMAPGDEALLIIKNKTASEKKILVIPRDEDRMKILKTKAHEITRAIDGTAEFKRQWLDANRLNNSECIECDFKTVCQPIVNDEPMQFGIEGEEAITELLKVRQTCLAASKEFNRVDRAVKEKLKAAEFKKVLIGDFVVEKKQSEVNTVKLPDDLKGQYTVKTTRTELKIRSIDEDDEE